MQNFDPTTFTTAAVPIAAAIIAVFTAYKLDLSKSRIASLLGLLAASYGAAAPFLGNLPKSWGTVIMIAGITLTALNERIQGGVSTKGIIAFVLAASVLANVACGPVSRKALTRLHGAGVAILATIDVNASLPDQLLAENLITADQYVVVRDTLAEVRAGVVAFNSGMETALQSERPDVKVLAPVCAQIIADLAKLRAFSAAKVQKFLSAAEISLRVIGSYFALQIAQAREAGLSDEQICARVGLKFEQRKFALLADTYDGARFEEYALAAGV